ncbi:hypothetical protein P7K49_011905 [Saguinus oedipus]|uniref:Uncharacterized protein n=1 Tax=Saguinus oedipus TaxID=9490 RepID=A0ABQ9VRZ7_SAGOE|nr:hypothetical protein P7K49_011905 [Saguinus oedipus]
MAGSPSCFLLIILTTRVLEFRRKRLWKMRPQSNVSLGERLLRAWLASQRWTPAPGEGVLGQDSGNLLRVCTLLTGSRRSPTLPLASWPGSSPRWHGGRPFRTGAS